MNELVTSPRRYALSFTAGALLVREGVLLALVYIQRRDWEQVRREAVRATSCRLGPNRRGPGWCARQ